MPHFFLQSTRLGFRTWQQSDLALALRLWGDPAVCRFITDRIFTEEQVRARLQQEIASQEIHSIQYWPIFLLQSGDHVGCCGLRPRQGQPRTPELGVHIASRYWRQGYAFEAASAVIQYAFAVLRFEALFAGHNPQNTASRALLLRLGFVHTHDEFYEPTGLMHPSYLLARREERAD
jgi:RimJ/RimL family protein N-acetyltransferase